MTLYSIALFLHVVGALGLFVAMALEWASLQQLQRVTTVEELGKWFKSSGPMRGIGGISMLIILVAGIYMAIVAWGGAQWISVAFISMIVMAGIGGVINSMRMRAIRKGMEGQSGPISTDLARAIFHPALWMSMLTRVSIGLGIIFLMTVKPALMIALIVMVIAVVLGLTASLIMPGNWRGQAAAV
jgi:hypothetical protein